MASSLLSGDYMAQKAAIDQAWRQALTNIQTQRGKTYASYGYNENGTVDPSQKYGALQQLEKRYGDQRRDFDAAKASALKGYGIRQLSVGGAYERDGSDGILARMDQDFATNKGRIEDARNRLQQITGLTGRFDGDKVTGVEMGEGRGQYHRLAEDQAWDLDELRDSIGSRGLGTGGLASVLRGRGETQAADSRGDFRNQVIDQLTQSRMQERDLTTGYSRAQTDIEREIQDMFNRFAHGDTDLSYQEGVDRNNLTQQLANEIAGLAGQEQQVGFDHNNQLSQAAVMAELMNRIATAGSAPAAPAPPKAPPKRGTGTMNTRAM